MATRQTQLLYSSRITKVKFNLAGSDSIVRDSFVPITSYDLFRNGEPFAGGLYDAHLGTTDHTYRCQTCYNNKRNCIGHAGHLLLNYPVVSPMAVAEMRKWMKLVCFKCGHPVIEESAYIKLPRSKRLDEASRIARTSAKKCIHCKEPHPIVKKDPQEQLALQADYYEDKKQVDKPKKLLPHHIKEILDRVTDEDVIKLGKNVNSHPRNFILGAIKIPPTTIRPDVKKMGGGRSTNDDITTMLQIIIKKNEAIPPVLPNPIDPKLEKAIFELCNAYYDLIKAGGDGMNSLSLRLRGKQGRFRKTQMGKRVRNMARSTITGDPSLRIDQVGVPLTFARNIQYEEVVQEFNKKRLMVYVNNGRKKYPGCTKVIKRATGTEYGVESLKDIELENGDIIYRDMITGDPVNFNRQPSLTVSNITTLFAVVCEDPSILTLRMNVLLCPFFNADFDGDQMNLIISTSISTRNEIAELSSAAKWLISHTTSSPALGQVDDSIIGSFELTRSNVKLDKYHAMLLFQNSTYLPSFEDMAPGATISGRDAVSKALEETPINFSRAPSWYLPNMAKYVPYDKSEIEVKIDQGKLVSGVLDKKSIGKGANGGLYHIIANEYGTDRALEVMFNMQQLAIAYIMQFGYTIGIMDLMVSEKAKGEIERIAADIMNKSRLITEKLNNGEIIPPIGKTVEEFYEEQQINNLRVFDDFTEPIMRDINPNTNNLFKLIACGSKGQINNMFNMVSAIGQKLINGERIRQKFGHKRTLAYYQRFETAPESRGYIPNSFTGGMTSAQYVFNAMNARFDLISKALSTSVTGEQNRKSIKNLESIISNNFRWATKGYNIIQFAYGEDFLDPRKVERVKFPTVMVADSVLESKYKRADTTDSGKLYVDFFNVIKQDRKKYREIFLRIENMNTKELMSDERRMPVDVERIFKDTTREYASDLGKTAPEKDVIEMTKRVNAFCEGLSYVLLNEIQEKRKTAIPEHLMKASWLLSMLTRAHLHPNSLAGLNAHVLNVILDKIRLRYSKALIAPGTAIGIIAAQSFSEPLTQYMLDAHHRSAAGGTSKGGMTRAKEVLGAKDVDQLDGPSMVIPVLPELETNQAKVQEIANNIEVMRLRQFVVQALIFFEKYKEIIHPRFKQENAMMEEFERMNPLLTPPGDLIKWCIRLVLNKTTLILKNMSLELIITRLRDLFPDTFIVYTPENAKQIVIRIYMRNSMFKSQIELNDIKYVKDQVLGTNIRGVDGILNTSVITMMRSRVNADGSVSKYDAFAITTNGTNMRGIFSNKYVDKYRVRTDAIIETARVLGIEAARQKIVSELRNLVSDINHRHYLIYADEMTYTGKVTSIERSGLSTREAGNILLRIGFSSPIQTMEEAAVNSMEDTINGVTAPLLVGSIPRHGTLYNPLQANLDFIKANAKRPDSFLEAL